MLQEALPTSSAFVDTSSMSTDTAVRDRFAAVREPLITLIIDILIDVVVFDEWVAALRPLSK